MKPDLEISGYWYLPNTPTNKVPGTLKVGSRGRIILELLGWPYDETNPIGRYPDVILGYSASQLPVTLVDCFLQSGPIQSANVDHVLSSRFGAVQAIVGHHYESRDRIKTREISVVFSRPDLWKLDYPIHQISNPNPRKLSKELHLNKPITLCKTDDLSISYHERFGASTSMGLEIQPHFKISTPRQINLDEYYPIVRALQSFVSLGCRVLVRPIDWRFICKPRRYYRRSASVHGRFTKRDMPEHDEHERFTTNADRLFDVNALKGFSSKIMATWMGNRNNFLPIYLLFLESIRDDDLSLDSRVLALAQAAEGFDRAMVGNDSHVNFKDRIEKLANNCPVNVINYIGSTSLFADKIRDIRHYYSHYFTEQSAFPHSPAELSDAHLKLRLVLEINLLKWAGLTEMELHKQLRRVWSYQMCYI
ncbi:MAG: hypothetical protein GY807_13990 [Gammaproteobacteria bacterium]|nr:hypothetical protein [Gammaproteobacteria bacterium]